MTIYKCKRCDKIFNQKYNYNRHINRKNQCSNGNHKESQKNHIKSFEKDTMDVQKNNLESFTKINNENVNMCKYCAKLFSTNSNYNRHMRYNCRKRKEIEEEKEGIFQRLLNKIEAIEKENIEIKKENMEVKEKLMQM